MDRDGEKGGIPMHRKAMLALNYSWIREFLASVLLVGCVSLTFMFFTQTHNPMMGYTQEKSCLSMGDTKKENILRLT